MRGVLLLTFVVCLLAGRATADLSFTLNEGAALMLTEISHSPTGVGIMSDLYLVTDDPDEYDSETGMMGQVGYVGLLDATKNQKTAWMRIGSTNSTSPTVEHVIGTALATGDTDDLSDYTEYSLFVANDNNSDWMLKLWINTDSGGRESGSTVLSPGDYTTLSLDLTGSGLNLANVTGIGFDVGGDMTGTKGGKNNPSDPDVFHISSVVPVHAAVILGILGLSVAGWKLRKFA
jgi:hypothetical protein